MSAAGPVVERIAMSANSDAATRVSAPAPRKTPCTIVQMLRLLKSSVSIQSPFGPGRPAAVSPASGARRRAGFLLVLHGAVRMLRRAVQRVESQRLAARCVHHVVLDAGRNHYRTAIPDAAL